jgi:hypothetical protein
MAIALESIDLAIMETSEALGVEVTFLPPLPTEQPTPLTD